MNPGEILVVDPNISSDDLEKTIETVNASYQKLALHHFYNTAPDATQHGQEDRLQRDASGVQDCCGNCLDAG